MNSTSFPALGNTHSFSCGETARSRVAKVDLQLLPSSCGTERDRFPQQSPEQTGLEREKGTGPGWAGMRGKGPGCGERGRKDGEGEAGAGSTGRQPGSPESHGSPLTQPRGSLGREIGGSALHCPTTTPGLSPLRGTPPASTPSPQRGDPSPPARGAPPTRSEGPQSCVQRGDTAPPPPATRLAATFQRLLQPLDVHDPPGRFPRGSARLPRPSPAQTGPRSQQDPALSDAPTWRPRRARARPRGPARRGRSHRAGPMGGPAAGAGSMGPA